MVRLEQWDKEPIHDAPGAGTSSESGNRGPRLSELIACNQVVENRQSVWARFELPRWITGPAATDDSGDAKDESQGELGFWNVSERVISITAGVRGPACLVVDGLLGQGM